MAISSSASIASLCYRRPICPSSSLASSSSSLFFNEGGSSIRANFGPKSRIGRKTKVGMMTCKCLFGLGVPELAVIAGVAALLFGPKNLPQVGKTFGKTIKSFQQAAKEFESELKKEPETSVDSPPEVPVAQSSEEKQKPEEGTKEKLDVTVSNTRES